MSEHTGRRADESRVSSLLSGETNTEGSRMGELGDARRRRAPRGPPVLKTSAARSSLSGILCCGGHAKIGAPRKSPVVDSYPPWVLHECSKRDRLCRRAEIVRSR